MNKIFAFEGHNGVGKSSVAKQVAINIKAKYLYCCPSI
jgi:cytidylate kinase